MKHQNPKANDEHESIRKLIKSNNQDFRNFEDDLWNLVRNIKFIMNIYKITNQRYMKKEVRDPRKLKSIIVQSDERGNLYNMDMDFYQNLLHKEI